LTAAAEGKWRTHIEMADELGRSRGATFANPPDYDDPPVPPSIEPQSIGWENITVAHTPPYDREEV